MNVVIIIGVLFVLAILTGVGLLERRIRLDLREERRRGLNRKATAEMDKAVALGKSCLAALLGFAPTILLVLTYELAPVPPAERIFVSAGVFGAAVLAAVVFRLIKPLPKASRFPWRNLLILLMAGLTVVLHDDLFIKIRPTVTTVVGAVLAFAALTGLNPRLDTWFDHHRHSLGDFAWRKLLMGIVFAELLYAALNVYVWQTATESFWIYFQLLGPPLFFGMLSLLGYVLLRDRLPAGQCPARSPEARSDVSDGQ